MNDTDFLFKELNAESVILYDYCNNFIDESNPNEMVEHYGFKGYPLDKSVWEKEPIISKIHDNFPILVCGIGFLDSNVIYDFHIDESRKVAVNMILRDDTSHSVFKGDNINYIQFKILELKYNPKKFYLYNTQVQHSVINLNKPRFFFSVQFEDKNLTYEELYDWAKNNELF